MTNEVHLEVDPAARCERWGGGARDRLCPQELTMCSEETILIQALFAIQMNLFTHLGSIFGGYGI